MTGEIVRLVDGASFSYILTKLLYLRVLSFLGDSLRTLILDSYWFDFSSDLRDIYLDAGGYTRKQGVGSSSKNYGVF